MKLETILLKFEKGITNKQPNKVDKTAPTVLLVAQSGPPLGSLIEFSIEIQ